MNRNSTTRYSRWYLETLKFSLNVALPKKMSPQAYKRNSEEKISLYNDELRQKGNFAKHPKALSKVGIHGAAGIICLCLVLFGPQFSPMYSLSPGFEQAQAQTSPSDNPTGDLGAFAAQYDKDGDGEADAPDEADQAAQQPEEPAAEPDEPAEVEEAEDEADSGDIKDDRDAESDGEEDAFDDARFNDQHDDDGDGGYDMDEGDGPDYAGSAPRGRTGTPRASLSRLGALSELTPLQN